jgi:hypothetical protein
MLFVRRFGQVPFVGLICLLICGCGPNRSAALGEAAKQQASLATGAIGSEDQVRSQARDGARLLKELSAGIVRNPPKGANPQVVGVFTADAAEVSAGLDSIADSKTDDQFTASVFNMCDAERRVAAPRVGHVLVGLATMIRAKPPANAPPQQVEQMSAYFDTFGERMINVPTECDRAQAGMAEAAAKEQEDEARHQANVNAAISAAELIFAGAVVYGTAVSAAQASRPIIVQSPPVQNNYYYGN